MANLHNHIENKTTEEYFQSIYYNLKTIPLDNLKNIIERNYSIYGDVFLDCMTTNSFLDWDLKSDDIRIKQRIRQIERTCNRIYQREDINNTVKKVLRSVPVWLAAIGGTGCFVIELIQLFLKG